MNQKKRKNKNIKINTAKNQVLKNHLEYLKNNPNKKKDIKIIKTEEKNKLKHRSMEFNKIIQYKTKIENIIDDLEDFYKSIFIKNQLKPDVTIF